jgi:hypothetical protein
MTVKPSSLIRLGDKPISHPLFCSVLAHPLKGETELPELWFFKD